MINIMKVKTTKSIGFVLTLLLSALVINVYADSKDSVSFDFDIQNLAQDSVLIVKITTPNPKWSGAHRAFPVDPKTGKPTKTCKDYNDCPKLTKTIQLNPGDEPYIEKDVQLGLGNFEIFISPKNSDKETKLLSGPLTFRGISGQSVKHNHGKKYTYDFKYDASTQKGNFGLILEDEKSEL